MEDGNDPVLEEPRQVEDDAAENDRGDYDARPAYRTERFRVVRVTDHDVSIDGKREGQPDGRHLEGECGRVEVRKQVGVDARGPRPSGRIFDRLSGVLRNERQRAENEEKITDGQGSQITIRRRVHLSPRKDERRQEVPDDSETANGDAGDSHHVVGDEVERVLACTERAARR